MSDITNEDLRLYAHLSNDYLDEDTWAPIPVDMVAIELKWSRQAVKKSIARLVDHHSLERKSADIVNGSDVIDTGFDIYRLV